MVRLQLSEKTEIDTVRDWFEQVALPPVLRVVYDLMLEGKFGFAELTKIIRSVVDSTLALEVSNDAADFALVVLDELQGFLKANIWHARVIVAAGENAGPQQHLLTEFGIVRHVVVAALAKAGHVDEHTVARHIHLGEHFAHSVRKQIGVFSDDQVDVARLEQIS